MLYDYSTVYDGLNGAVDYIRSLLSALPAEKLRSDAVDSHEPLQIEDNLDALEFVPVAESPKTNLRSAAIDGGQGRIASNSLFTCAVYRSGMLVFEGRGRVAERIGELQLANLNSASYRDLYAEQYRELYNSYPAEFPAFSDSLNELRHLRENALIKDAVSALKPGDMLLLDGSFRAGNDDEHRFLKAVAGQARANRIDIVAVSKASALIWRGGASLVGVIKKLGNQRCKDKNWYVKIGTDYPERPELRLKNIYVSRMSPYSSQAYRVDICVNNNMAVDEIFETLAFLCSDPFFSGYPYPLAAVHQAVRLSEDELSGLRLRLKQVAVEAGISDDEWSLLFEDYHDTLNYDLKASRATTGMI